MNRQDARGLKLSATNSEAVGGYEAALDLYLRYAGDPEVAIASAIEADPGFALAHVFRAYMHLLTTEGRRVPAAQAAVTAAKSCTSANERERGHVAAVDLWADGDSAACAAALERLLIDEPLDLLALAVGHYVHFLRGQVREQRDIVARALPAWDETVPGYGFVLGLHSFGLSECGDHSAAEESGREAVHRNAGDNYAIHAVTHVLEAGARSNDGIAWLEANDAVWRRDNFAVHLGWHKALFHLEREEPETCLKLYDCVLRRVESDAAVDLNDASALLWRLGLLGLDVGSRWDALANYWEAVGDGHTHAFNDMHAMMAFAATRRREPARRLIAALEVVSRGSTTNAAVIRRVGLAICRGFEAFGRDDYAAVIDHILPVRYECHVLGGSLLQQDIVAMTLIEAALRAGEANLAFALAAERSVLNVRRASAWRLRARAARLRGDIRAAQHAERLAAAERAMPDIDEVR